MELPTHILKGLLCGNCLQSRGYRPRFASLLLFRQQLHILVKIDIPRFRRFIVDHLPFKDVKQVRGIIDSIQHTSTEILEAKKRALQEGDEAIVRQIGQGKDITSILCTCDPEVMPIISLI